MSTIAPSFRVVPMDVVRNLVARSVARNRTRASTRDFMVRLHLMPDGGDISGDIGATLQMVEAALHIASEQQRQELQAAHDALLAMRDDGGRWRCEHLHALTAGLEAACEVVTTATPDRLQAGYAYAAGRVAA